MIPMAKPRPSIPTKEEFERASQLLGERLRLEARVKDGVLSRIGSGAGIHDLWISISHMLGNVHARLFVPHDRDLDSPQTTALRDRVAAAVLDTLGAEGLGRRENISLQVEVDSDE